MTKKGKCLRSEMLTKEFCFKRFPFSICASFSTSSNLCSNIFSNSSSFSNSIIVPLGKTPYNVKSREFRNFRGRSRKEQFEDLDNKHLYWNINNMKEEYLKKENDNFFNRIEHDKIEEQIADIVGTENFIPNNEKINEPLKTNSMLKNKSKYKNNNSNEKEKLGLETLEKLERIKKIFNPSLEILECNNENKPEDIDHYYLKQKMKECSNEKEKEKEMHKEKEKEMEKEKEKEMEKEKQMKKVEMETETEIEMDKSFSTVQNSYHKEKKNSYHTDNSEERKMEYLLKNKQDKDVRIKTNCFIYKKMEKLKNVDTIETKQKTKNILGTNSFDNNIYPLSVEQSAGSNQTDNMNSVETEESRESKQCENNNVENSGYDFVVSSRSRNKGVRQTESLFDYESLKNRSMYQDLTHEEYARMHNLYIKKCDIDRKIRWFKMSDVMNPLKEAKSIMNSLKLSDDDKKKKSIIGKGITITSTNTNDDYVNNGNSFLPEENIKPFYENDAHVSDRIEKLCEKNQYDEIVSRIRMKIRKEKMENSKIIKEKIPNVARNILDPIKFHVNRRRIRVEKLVHTHLEQLLNCNNSYFKFYLLNGLSISIHHLEMKTPRSLCKIVYSLLNKNIRHEDIKDKLDKVAFILRRLLARKLQLGYTPPLQFVPLADKNQTKIKHLQYFKLYSKYKYPFDVDAGVNDKQLNNSKLIDYYNKETAGF